jgi:hypothetical protein
MMNGGSFPVFCPLVFTASIEQAEEGNLLWYGQGLSATDFHLLEVKGDHRDEQD